MLKNLFKNKEEASSIQGALDEVRSNIAYGWAWNKKEQDKKLNIEIVANERVIGIGKANLLRSDLIDAHIGNGTYGFAIDISEVADTLEPDTIIKARTAQGDNLSGEFSFTYIKENVAINKLNNADDVSSLKINFEEYGISNNKISISGWAFSEQDIDNVEVFFMDKKIGEAQYGLERNDVFDIFENDQRSKSSGFFFERNIADLTNKLNLKVNFKDKSNHIFNLKSVQENNIQALFKDVVIKEKKRGERSTVLFISPHLPDYDTSSGGKRATRMLSLIAEEADVYCYTLGDKQQKYIDKLAEHNVNVINAPHLRDIDINTFQYPELRKQLAHIDVIIYAWYDMWYLNSRIKSFYPNARLIFDSVDIHWVRHHRLIGIDPNMTKDSAMNSKQGEKNAYKEADIVWAVTEEDKQAVLKELPYSNVKVVSNVHDPDMSVYKDNGKNTLLFFGGFKHTPNLSAAKVLAHDIMPLVVKEIPDAQLILAGAHAPKEISDLGKLDYVDYRGFIEEEDLEQLYEDSFATVIPLLAGAGIKGKICEAICYMLPIITNDVGNEGINLVNEVNGLVTNDIEEMAALTIKALKREYNFESFTISAQDKLAALVGSDIVKQQMIESINKEVSICIVTWNRIGLLKRCIESVIEQTTYPFYKILVYSNGCEDGTQEYLEELAKEDDRIVPILSDENEVFVIPNNKMMMHFPENDVVLLNNDTYVTKGWLQGLVDVAYQDKNIGMTGSKILYPNGRLQEFGSILNANYSGNNFGKNDDPNKPQFNKQTDVGYVSGCSLFIKRSTINRIGVFDTKFHPCYCEDSDLCYTAAEHGLRTVVTPTSVIYHDEGGTSGTDTSSGFKAYQNVNFLKFYQKHIGKLNGINWGLNRINHGDILKSYKSKYKDYVGRVLLNGTQRIDSVSVNRAFNSIKSIKEFNLYKEEMIPVYRKRFQVESLLVKNRSDEFVIRGFDINVNKDAFFTITGARTESRNGQPFPNYRESMISSETEFNSRLRATSLLIDKSIENQEAKSAYFTEYKTAFTKYYATKFKNIAESENLGESADEFKTINHETLDKLSYKDNEFDLLVSLEKLQHYENYIDALKEFYRVMKPGGQLILSLPFNLNSDYNIEWSKTNEETGEVEHKENAIYYPNPIKKLDPLLCYNHFGWEFLQELESCGFTDVSADFIWSLYYGILGNDIMLIKATK